MISDRISTKDCEGWVEREEDVITPEKKRQIWEGQFFFLLPSFDKNC